MDGSYRRALDAPGGDLTWIDDATLERAIAYSRTSPRGRVILPFHGDAKEPLHRMLNAIQPWSYVRPHRHLDPPKAEAFVVLRGAVAFFTFDDDGTVRDCARIGHGEHRLGVDLAPGVFHAFVALVPDTVIYEVKPGPYAPDTDKAFAAFAPDEGSDAAEGYRRALLELYEQRASVRLAEIDWRPPTLESERLLLRGYEPSDADDVFHYASDDSTTRLMSWDRHESPHEARRFLNGPVADAYRNRQLDYAVCLRAEPARVIGGVGVYARGEGTAELGYVLSREHWGGGLMPEAARRLLDHVFEETDTVRVAASIYRDNARSCRVAEKLGMTLEGVLRAARERHGVRKDEVVYAVLRDEWCQR